MPASQHTERLRQAFNAIAASKLPIRPEDIQSFQTVLCAAAEDMKRAGMPLERAIAGIKRLATEAGIRESHDRLITSAVIWCVEAFCRNEPVPHAVIDYLAARREATAISPSRDFDRWP